MGSLVEHFLVLLEFVLEFLVAAVLRVDGGDVAHVADAAVVVLLELPLVGLDLLPQLPPFRLDPDYRGLDALLAHLLAAAFGEGFLEFLVVDVEGAEGLLLLVVGLPLEAAAEVVVVALQLVLHLLLLVGQAVHAHRLDVGLQLHSLAALGQSLLQPQLPERLLQPPRRLLLHPLRHRFVDDLLRPRGGGAVPRRPFADEGERVIIVEAVSAGGVLLLQEAFQFSDFGLALDGDLLRVAEEVEDGGSDQLVQYVELHLKLNAEATPKS